jgi:hypothetical protein
MVESVEGLGAGEGLLVDGAAASADEPAAGLKISKTCWHFAQRIFFEGFPSNFASSYWYRAWQFVHSMIKLVRPRSRSSENSKRADRAQSSEREMAYRSGVREVGVTGDWVRNSD